MNKINKLRNGFSLVETIFSLLIISIAISLMGLTFQQMRRNNIKQQQESEIYRYIDLLESKQFSFKPLMIKDNRLFLYSSEEGRTYIIEHYKNQIKMKAADGGYMPLVLHVEAAEWKIVDHKVISKIYIGGRNYVFSSKPNQKG